MRSLSNTPLTLPTLAWAHTPPRQTNFEDDMELKGCLGLLTKGYRRSKQCFSPRPSPSPMTTTPEGQQGVLSRNVMRDIDLHEGTEYPDHMKGGVGECKGDTPENSENPMRSTPEVHRRMASRANAAEKEGVKGERLLLELIRGRVLTQGEISLMLQAASRQLANEKATGTGKEEVLQQ